VLLGLDNIGEQTLNRIAEMALSSQLDHVDELDVQIKTNMDLLAKGQLASMLIDGQGLIMQKSLRMQRMKIQIGEIAVNPMTALMGNIQLTRPTQGSAHITLSAQDLNQAFNSKLLNEQMRGLTLDLDDQSVTLDVQQVNCELLDGEIQISATIALSHGQSQTVKFCATPTIVDNGRRVHLESIRYSHGQGLPEEITAGLVQQAADILDLSNFEMDGISLKLQKLKVTPAALILEATAHVTRFPKV
jgi:hypothetical protein